METTKKISISDLSVGDWVQARMTKWDYDDLDITPPMRVVQIGNDEVKLELNRVEHYAFVDDLQPIPITAEVLEKNGFEETCGRWYNSDILMEFEQYKDGWDRTINCGEYSVYFIKYVHQLQHAIRLARIDKQIDI